MFTLDIVYWIVKRAVKNIIYIKNQTVINLTIYLVLNIKKLNKLIAVYNLLLINYIIKFYPKS